VGRGDIVFKRVDLIIRLAKQLYENNIPAQISFMGNVEPVIAAGLRRYGIFLGEQVDEKIIDEIYRNHQALILLSTSEGFPMVVMEAMARGLAIIATKVGDIPYHVKDEVNGLLIDYPLPDNEILAKAQLHIETLITNRQLLKQMQENNIAYAKDKFGLEVFGKSYRNLLLQ
jgi:glycosyltransferase involved in cell wall biosynthesis